MNSESVALDDSWRALRQLTPARIAIGRAGASLTTRAHLEFQLAHARARDAVHAALEVPALERELHSLGLEVLAVESAAADHGTYLRRPDLGRRLSERSHGRLASRRIEHAPDATVVVADGLSALAAQRHTAPLLSRVIPSLYADGWRLSPTIIVERGRVAIGDEIAQLFDAALVVVLIGERPGLSSPDSLGAYLTWQARPGTRDASRNCISNIRAGGLGYDLAAHKLVHLMREARRRKLTGIALKENTSEIAPNVERGRLPARD